MDLLKAYNTVNMILDTIDFDILFEGFHKYRFALYSSEEIVMDGKAIPYRDDFRGNTAKEYEGEYVAIWNMEADPVEDMERLAYLLVHEMFHCHQFTNNETRFPSDLMLLNYPADVDNFTKKYNENRYLAKAYEQGDMEQLRKFSCIRESRYKKYPDMVCQEWKVETLEGMAEYIGLKALEFINKEKYFAIVEEYLGKLREESKLLFDVRRISYYTGAVFFLCMEKFGLEVSNAFDSELTAYEQNVIDTTDITAEVLSYDFIPSLFAELEADKKSKLKECMEHVGYTECHASICGYDPMNMFRQGGLIYCNHFVCLNENGKVKNLFSAAVLKLAEGSDRDVVGYYKE